MKRTITQIFILAVTLTSIIYDVIVYLKFGNPSTISATIWRWCYHIPGIPLLIGILIGHLAFQMHEPTEFPTKEKK